MALKIIYIDDEPDICEAFAVIMESDALQIITFTSPIELLKSIDSINADLIISDYRMPSMTGVELARKLSPSLPKVLLTGELNLKDTSEFVQIFKKPCDYKALDKFLKEFEAKTARGSAS